MNQEKIDFWQSTFVNTEKFMEEHHRRWRRLHRQYRLDFNDVVSLDSSKTRKISQFYPLARQIIASIVFQNPRIFFRVSAPQKAFQAEIMQRTINNALELSDAKAHVQQMVFDALFAYRGILKTVVNPQGDDDLMPPYVANDTLQNGMVATLRVSPFNFFGDIVTPNHVFGHQRYCYEKMLVPMEFVKADERLQHKADIKPLTADDREDLMLGDWESDQEGEDVERKAQEESRILGEYVLFREVHDRIHKKQYIFAQGVKKPVLEIDHPFLAGETRMAPDPLTGEMVATDDFTPRGGFLVMNGTPYTSLTYDNTPEEFYGLPVMAYAEDTQAGIVESLTRRADGIKRNSRTILGRKGEQANNPDIGDDIDKAQDGKIIWVDDVHNSFSEMTQATPPADQLGLESDYRNYQEQILNVSSLTSGGGPRRTATQAALEASFGQLNRDWMQGKVAQVYKELAYNYARIISDVRYEPKAFLINVAESENDPVFEAVRGDMMAARFTVEVEAASMKPMFEEIEKEDALALATWLMQFPQVPRNEVLRHVLQSFRVPNMEKFIGDAARIDAQRAAQYENLLLMSGQQVRVHPGEQHTTHAEVHKKLPEDPKFQQLAQANQMLAQQIMQAIQQHLQEHQEAFQAQAGGGGGQTQPSGNIESIGGDGRGTGSPLSQVQQTVGSVNSAVRSNAQRISQPGAVIDRNQN